METKTDVGFLLAGTPSYKDLQNVYLKCALTAAQKNKNPDITCYEVIKKIIAKGGPQLTDDYLFGLSIVCEDFLKGSTKFNTCGLKTAKDMVEKINEILEKWLPF